MKNLRDLRDLAIQGMANKLSNMEVDETGATVSKVRALPIPNPQPCTLDPQPCTLDPQPSTLHPKPLRCLPPD